MITSPFQIGTQTKKITEKSYKKKLDMSAQIIRNLNYLLYESKNCPCYVWCINLNSVWDMCYILESYIVMSNIILKWKCFYQLSMLSLSNKMLSAFILSNHAISQSGSNKKAKAAASDHWWRKGQTCKRDREANYVTRKKGGSENKIKTSDGNK